MHSASETDPVHSQRDWEEKNPDDGKEFLSEKGPIEIQAEGR